ncbi:MAG: hypothetical protein ACJ8AX_02860 [Gemmatimonadales bacterium]
MSLSSRWQEFRTSLPAFFRSRRPLDFSHLVEGPGAGAVILVGTEKDGFIPGKLTASLFLPIFARACAHRGFQVMAFPNPADFLSRKDIPQPVTVIMVYSEVRILRAGLDPTFQKVLERAQRLGARVVHPPETGLAIADKLTTRDLLIPAGIRMPELVTDTAGMVPVFSNEIVGSNRPVQLHASDALDPSRYNTRYIDAVHHYQSRAYHVSLRAMAVGTTCVAVYVRARAVGERNPSVHNKNTPLDPELLNHLHAEIVEPRRDEIHSICQRIGFRLGLGFYAHDIVPERASGLLYVCETGFKFDDHAWRNRMAPLRGSLACDDGDPSIEVVRSAEAFLSAPPPPSPPKIRP